MGLQSMADASPTKWHLAHTTWFFETFVLKPNQTGYQPFDPAYEFLFNSYYNAVGAQFSRPDRGLLSRPSLQDILAYRAHVDQAMQQVEADPTLITLGLNHEQQHQELIVTDIKHALSINPLHPEIYPAGDEGGPASAPAHDLAFEAVDGGIHTIGHQGPGFHFDNEGPAHEVLLRPYQIANRCVTNAEWQAFMDDGGYETPSLWLADGWAKVQAEGWQAPLYWQQVEGAWIRYGLHGLAAPNPHAPVTHISQYEADAFATWAGARLPTEFEWEHWARGADPSRGQQCDDGRPHEPTVADASPFGGVWQWTQSAYLPYPGFKPAAGAVGEYNGKFMSGQMVLKGGSCATPRGHLRASYRNFFYAPMRWQFSGLRMAKDG
ncbi:MAG: ergothioneine biosynthesis protein EgtB [Alphaproteobacteria bacterium]